jgi:hypothetical protein
VYGAGQLLPSNVDDGGGINNLFNLRKSDADIAPAFRAVAVGSLTVLDGMLTHADCVASYSKNIPGYGSYIVLCSGLLGNLML